MHKVGRPLSLSLSSSESKDRQIPRHQYSRSEFEAIFCHSIFRLKIAPGYARRGSRVRVSVSRSSFRSTQEGKVARGIGFRSPIGDSPFGNSLPKGHRSVTEDTLVMLTSLLTSPSCFDLKRDLLIRPRLRPNAAPLYALRPCSGACDLQRIRTV